MRASSLSDERAIRLVSQYFVPVHVSRDNYLLDVPDRATLQIGIGAAHGRFMGMLTKIGFGIAIFLISVYAAFPVHRR